MSILKKYDIYIDFKKQEKQYFFWTRIFYLQRIYRALLTLMLCLILLLFKWDTSFWGFPVATVSSRINNILHRVNHYVKKKII